MDKDLEKLGIKAVLTKRMLEQRLPRALALKEKVDRGEPLDDFDLKLLQDVVTESRSIDSIVEGDASARDVAERMMALYKEIADRALENEKSRPQGSA